MHRDTKLGLALAILVMGFAAALCFPRQSGEDQGELSLQTAADLDAAIRLMSAKTYTDADRRESRPAEMFPAESLTIESQPLEEVLPLAGVPDPIQVPGEPEPTPVTPNSLPPEVIAEPEQPVVHTSVYQVQPNDTLMGIAKKELGSTNRWRELLDINPILGGNPLALRHGMELIIPILAGDDISPTPPPETRPAPTTIALPSSPASVTRPSMTPIRPGRFSSVPRVGSSNISPTAK